MVAPFSPQHPADARELPPEEPSPLLSLTSADPRAVLRDVPWASGLSEADSAALSPLWRHVALADGEAALEEAVSNHRLFVVSAGDVSVRKRWEGSVGSTTTDNTFELAQLSAGDCFGELSFLDGGVTSAAVLAKGPCLLLALDADAVAGAVDDATWLRLRAAVATAVVRRMRNLNETHVRALSTELLQQQTRVGFAQFFAVTIVLFAIASTVQRVISEQSTPLAQIGFSWGLLLVSLAPLAWFAFRQKLPWRDFGLSWHNWRQSVLEGLAGAGGIALLALLVRLGQRLPDEPLLQWGGTVGAYPPLAFWTWQLAYPLHCFLQELMGRGIIQGALARFMSNGHPMAPIFMTSALFGVYHLYVSLSFALITFVVSVLLGTLYRRHGSLLGVSLVHYALGLASVAIGLN